MEPVELYDFMTEGCTKQRRRIDDVLYASAEWEPGPLPTREQMVAERERPLAEKEGLERAQGQWIAEVLADPRTGTHLLETMLRPTARAWELIDEFVADGEVDLGHAHVKREGAAGVLELRNPRHLNAEDGVTLGPTETAVDLILMHPEIEIGVFRGGFVDHPRYAGRRVFGAGINLTHLYMGKIDFLFYLIRDFGYVNKLYRGILNADGTTSEKLWIGAVEEFAIGGHCQLTHVVDHVIAVRGSRLYLPARKEGIIPGASNLRLPRFVGDRAARQAIMSGREWVAGEPDADLLCDEIVEADEMDGAIASRVEALTSAGLVNAAANRAAIRVGQEPFDLYRQYMSTYSREQADCHLSPALVRNLERNWNAHQRTL
jgi:(3,5-dihydroxyphenyl)acetyl-CoA 1,2-dioxygenase